jgi:hypothetical protein
MKYDGIKGYTLDIDATGIEAEKTSRGLIRAFQAMCPRSVTWLKTLWW